MDGYAVFHDAVMLPLEGIVILLLFLQLTGNNGFILRNKLMAIVYLTIFTAGSYFITHYFSTGIHIICQLLFVMTLLHLITKTNIYASIVSVIIIYFFISIIDTITVTISAAY